jgi:hypothetical protein
VKFANTLLPKCVIGVNKEDILIFYLRDYAGKKLKQILLGPKIQIAAKSTLHYPTNSEQVFVF